jgi:6-phosphogluconolactonase
MVHMRKFGFVIAASLLMPLAHAAPKAKSYFVYIGTYTNNTTSKGIYVYRLNPATGEVTDIGLAAETTSPSFLAADPKGRFVYAVNEIGDYKGEKAGSVSAFSVDPKTGKLTFLNAVSTKSPGPCHLAVDKTAKTLLVANYSGGSVTAFPIGADGKVGESTSFDQHTGSGPDAKRQEAPHAHCANISANNKFAMVNDLGLDKVFVYKLDAAGSKISPNSPATASVKPGSGPRHFAFHPNNKNAYVINEMASTVTGFDYDARKGALKEIQTISTLPADYKGDTTTAEIFVHPSGKFLYGSNRGHDSIAVFSIDAAGKLTYVENTSTQGQVPRGFGIDPTGKYLIAGNQKTDNVVVFAIDQATGKLKATGKTMTVGAPVSVMFVAAK